MQNVEHGIGDQHFSQLIDKVNFFTIIWHKGAFESEFEFSLQITLERLNFFLQSLKNEKFLSVDLIENSKTKKVENYYSVSKENLKNIFIHICKSSHMDMNSYVLNFLLEDKVNIVPDLANDIETRLRKNNTYKFLERSLSYFFLFIMSLSPNVAKNVDIKNFLINATSHLEIPLQSQISSEVTRLENNLIDESMKENQTKTKDPIKIFIPAQSDYIFKTTLTVLSLVIIILILKVLGQVSGITNPMIQALIISGIGVILFPIYYLIQYFYNKEVHNEEISDLEELMIPDWSILKIANIISKALVIIWLFLFIMSVPSI